MADIGPTLLHAGLNLDAEPREEREHTESGIFGFWAFLMSDAVVFALLFAIYGTMLRATAGGPGPAQEFDIGSAFVETLLLLTSSFTFGLASLSMKFVRRRRSVALWLVVTLVLGLGFLGMEAHDFAKMVSEGATAQRSGFLSSFFVLVGMHGMHVTSGCIWIVVMLVQLLMFGLDKRVKLNILRLGLFWHFLDIVWVCIFSIVYLQGLIG